MTFRPEVDILFVVDDSNSMLEHQRILSQNIERFTYGIEKNQILDYHIGVITTTMERNLMARSWGGRLVGAHPNFVTRNTPQARSILADLLLVGYFGSLEEKMFEPIRAALTAPLTDKDNLGFYRDNAHLSIVLITDTDDGTLSTTPQEFYNFLLSLKKFQKDKISMYAALISSGDETECPRDRSERPPERIQELLRLLGGQAFGLCDFDYGDKLSRLSLDLVHRAAQVMPLDLTPDLSTIEVWYGDQMIPMDVDRGWSFDPKKNALIFGDHLVLKPQISPFESVSPSIEVRFSPAHFEGDREVDR